METIRPREPWMLLQAADPSRIDRGVPSESIFQIHEAAEILRAETSVGLPKRSVRREV